MDDTLKKMREGRLSGPGLAAALHHVRSCSDCIGELRELGDAAALRRMLSTVPPAEHLDFETELVPYTEEKVDAATREILETHLESCPTCTAEVADLRELRKAFRRRPRRSRWVVSALAAGIVAVIVGAMMRSEGPERRGDAPVPRIATETATPPPAPPPAPQPRYANAAWTRLVDGAVAARTLPFPVDLAALTSPPDALRDGAPRATGRFSPAGMVVPETRPLFSWPARDDATYVVSVFAGDEEVARSETLAAATWRPARDLTRGSTYVWQVEVHEGDATVVLPEPPAPQATFRVASAKDMQEIEEARAAHPQDDFLHAVLSAKAGLRREATEALQRAAASGDPRALSLR